ncbi:Use1p [Sugiyamaella lignohabitans]|uniref:Use1p n=1 Tax=Sugiyamaella lignohabitans TaxID=796027 RepID=A0A167FC81_9ASCO|nr:Use1p [Sugiyamaella lignohabitans]ANB15105.1 Use1p [Sugiyamaella lignohabitans]
MDYARSILLDLESDIPKSGSHNKSRSPALSNHRAHIQKLNDRIQEIELRVRSVQKQEAENFRKSQSKQNAPEPLADVNASTESLRKRLAAGSSTEHKELSVESKVSLQKDIQDSLSSEILGMVSTLKNNAIAFAEKIAQDKDVVEGTSSALNKTAGTMNKVGSRLNDYRSTKAIGWWFYIWAIVFMVVAVSGSMIVVRLFPKW